MDTLSRHYRADTYGTRRPAGRYTLRAVVDGPRGGGRPRAPPPHRRRHCRRRRRLQ